MAKLRVHNFAISLEGYGAGPNQSLDNPLGVGGSRIHEWAFKLKFFREMHGDTSGDFPSTHLRADVNHFVP